MSNTSTARTRIADLGKPRIIIIGGGFGGLEVAKGLKKAKAQVVLFDRYNYHTFQPLLYQVASSGLDTSSIVFPFRKRFAKQPDFFFRMGEVISIKPEENYIETSIGGIKYDYLVIANGATTNYYGLKDVEENAIPMKSIIDAIQLRNKVIRNMEMALLTDDDELMNSLMDYVIVGGGPTGVHLVEAGPRLLNGMSKKASEKALEYLQNMGVKVHLNCAVKSYNGYEVILNTGEKLISRTMVWAAGVKGKPIEGLNENALTRSGRIRVDQFNKVVGHENIFAIGDAAIMEGDEKYPAGHPMMAPPAIQQGRLLAKNLKRLLAKKEMKPFSYFDKGSMATIGRNRAVVDIKGFKFQGIFAWFVWMFVHLMYIIGFRNKFFVMFTWFVSYFSYDKSNRLIISRNKDGIT
jgi:NADH dehydrogenase